MNLDERLLTTAGKEGAAKGGVGTGEIAGGQDTSNDRVSALSQARRPGQELAPRGDGGSDRPTSLREAVQARKRQQAVKAKAAEAAGEGGVVATPISRSTGKLLQQAWMHLPDSLGLSLIWINIHVFLGAVFGNKFFCKLGAEWLDNNIATAQADYAKKQGKIIGAVEPMGLACCNLGCLALLIAIAVVVGTLLKVFTSPWEFF